MLPARLACVSLVLGLLAGPGAGHAAEPAATVDLARFSGRWYVIARAPATEPREVGAYVEYRAGADGRIEERYSARRGAFGREPLAVQRTASADPERPSRWEMRTGWLATAERWVLYVSADYRYALAGMPEDGEAWVLAREPVIPEWSYAGLVARLALLGYDVSRFRRVAQEPRQLGLPGFE